MLSGRFEFSTHKLCKNKWIKNYTQKFWEKNHVSDFQPMLNTHISWGASIFFHLKKYMTFIKINNTLFLGIHTCGFGKYKPDIDMSKNYIILRFTMFNRLFCCSFWLFYNTKSCLSVCGETNTYSTAMSAISLKREFNYLSLWYISSADCLIRTSTTDIYVTLPPNFRQVRGYPRISGQKTPMGLNFELLTSKYVF